MSTAIRQIEVAGRYRFTIGSGVMAHLEPLVAGRRVLLVHQPGRDDLLGEVVRTIESGGGTPHLAGVPDAEAAKNVEVCSQLWAQLGTAGFTRDDLIVGLGGGAVTDLAGFIAATWLRGVDVVQLPTSLLAAVDAAVGGKTGINTAEGKNLVGAFHEPVAVLCDPSWFSTQSRGDYVSGLAEVIKCGLIADPVILDLVATDPAAAVDPGASVAVDLVGRAVQVKADVVAADLKESSLREILNYGHTFAHAIEQVEGYSWRHGDAVAVGLVYVAELAAAAGRLDRSLVDVHREALSSVGLPTTYEPGRWRELRSAMARDKKARGSALRFVILDGALATPARLESPDESLLEHAYAQISPPAT